MKTLPFYCLVLTLLAVPPVRHAMAWGPAGHAAIGRAAVAALAPGPRAELAAILQAASDDAMNAAIDEACFWPDTLRASPEGSWSRPLHYVNIPRSDRRYDRQRDCPQGRCVTGGILEYAGELGRTDLDRARRREAFAWLCHLVGDLHQPLHAGFRDDRGGNRVDIEYRGEHTNLHRFWDSTLVDERLAGGAHSLTTLATLPAEAASGRWNPADVARWTEESHSLAESRAYPPGPVIDDGFADESWRVIREQWRRAATRLALILNEVLAGDPATD